MTMNPLCIGSLPDFYWLFFLFFFLWVVFTCVLICLVLLIDGFSSLIFIYKVFLLNSLTWQWSFFTSTSSLWANYLIVKFFFTSTSSLWVRIMSWWFCRPSCSTSSCKELVFLGKGRGEKSLVEVVVFWSFPILSYRQKDLNCLNRFWVLAIWVIERKIGFASVREWERERERKRAWFPESQRNCRKD